MIGHSLKNIVYSLGVAYDFAFCQNKWSLKIFQNVLWKMSFENDKIYQSVWGTGSKTNIKKIGVWWVQTLRNFRSSRKLRYENIIFVEDDSIFFLVFRKVFW